MSRKNSGCGLLALVLLLMTPFPVLIAANYWTHYTFSRDCGSWLKMAADANSIYLAEQRLGKALDYLEKAHLTEGNTAIILATPASDIEPWYQNLKEARLNLQLFPERPTQADVNTALAKLRETLLDHGKDGDVVTVPPNIAYHPHNLIWALASGVSVVLAFVGLLILCVVGNDN